MSLPVQLSFLQTGHLALLAGLLVLLGENRDLPAQEKKPSVKLTGEQQQQLAESGRLWRQAQELRAQGKFPEAVQRAKKSLSITRELQGDDHPNLSDRLKWLAEVYEKQGDYPAARQARQEVLELLTRRLGKGHWQVTNARLELAHVDRVASLNAAQRQRLAEADRLEEQVNQLANSRKYKEAIPLATRVLEIRKEFLGERQLASFRAWNNVGWMYRDSGDYAGAEPMLQQLANLRKQVLGNQHPDYGLSLNLLGWLYHDRGDFDRAERCFKEAHQVYLAAVGEEDVNYATTVANLGRLYLSRRDFAKAEPLLRKALELRRRLLTSNDADLGLTLFHLGELYDDQQNWVQAERFLGESLEVYRKAVGEKHADYARTLNKLALLYDSLGDYPRAEPLFLQARDICKETLGEKHPYYATSLHNLGLLYESMGDYARGESLLQQAWTIRKAVLKESHSDYADSLVSLGSFFLRLGEYTQAVALFQQVLNVEKKVRGENHPDYATNLNNLAMVYESMGDYARAEPLFQQARNIRKKALGEKHPDYATSLNNLAGLYRAMGESARAMPLCQQALSIKKAILGEKHPSYALGLHNQAMLYQDMGEYGRAEPFFQEALAISRQHLDLTAAIQSERQQLAMVQEVRSRLDNYLRLILQAHLPAPNAYGHVLAWKGAILQYQMHLRHLRRRPELAADFEKLDQVTRQLATLALAVPSPQQAPRYRRKVQELTDKKERLESELARRSSDFRQLRQQARRSPQQLQQVLPPEVALVDFLEFWRSRERHLAAFVVRLNNLQLLDLGPVEPIEEAFRQWQTTLARRTRPLTGPDDPAGKLRACLWQPLESHLQGAHTVLLSPDGLVGRLPLGALPGSRPDRYLLEERAIVLVSVPQLLPELLARPAPSFPADASLLLVGDVHYGGEAGQAADHGGRRAATAGSMGRTLLSFHRLPATRRESVAVQRLFQQRFPQGSVQFLHQEQATEATVRREAPNHRWLHLATHGFFAPPSVRSALAPVAPEGSERTGRPGSPGDWFGRQGVSGFHPGLLSGLVLTGANQPVREGQDDGILTALEVAELNLEKVELAALSACETGLGKAAGGEGLLGLQRAFQVAGARSVLASLWGVADEATEELMVRFYQNLWEKKLPKLEALRQAQLWMLERGVHRSSSAVEERLREMEPWLETAARLFPWPGVAEGLKEVRGWLRETRGRLARGTLVPLDAGKRLQTPGRTPPYYWAAFVLSGDWR